MPSKQAEKLANLLADQQLDLDELAEEYQERVQARLEELMFSASERDPEIWASAEADVSMTISDFGSVPVFTRLMTDWEDLLERAYTAAYMQAAVDTGFLRDILIIAENHSFALKKTSEESSNEELREVAEEGVLNGKLDERKNVRANQS